MRTGLEVSVVVIGFLMGGVVGVGTLIYTLAIGPMVQAMLPYAIVELPARDTGPVLRAVPSD
ncbi:hypothetical protein EFK50_04260 [Nocardioides marmoriginsengisoli]|uniref:Uncharacterized protein n=1 Tax=Nocardioides marmoriginsengisoli TaxID=661483 RepID=A0A3N0CP14_9ACTN|nr:hypothetical protein EFK50_04260 [Nocardioides marmoriginsengisoli]